MPVLKNRGKITDARNKAGHALMKRRDTDKELSVNKAIRKVTELVEETERILGKLP
jgi:hypothetical protein